MDDIPTKVTEFIQLIKHDVSNLSNTCPPKGHKQEIKNLMFALIDIRHMAKLAADELFPLDFYCDACDDPECVGECDSKHHCECCGEEIITQEEEFVRAMEHLIALDNKPKLSVNEKKEHEHLKTITDEYIERTALNAEVRH